jgi:hypothetical protein
MLADSESASAKVNAARGAALDLGKHLSEVLQNGTAARAAGRLNASDPAAVLEYIAEVNRLLADQNRLTVETNLRSAEYNRLVHLRQAGTFRMLVSEWSMIAAIWGLAAIGIYTRRLKKRRDLRIKNNQCVICGYDLRASKGRCSECGTEIPLAAAVVK